MRRGEVTLRAQLVLRKMPQHFAGMGAGGVVVFDDDFPGDKHGFDALGRSVGILYGRAVEDSGGIEECEIGDHARCDASAVGQPELPG
jgi:hypothetical protein